jgi:hypothetical protein
MAYSKFEQAYVNTYMDTMYPMEPEEPAQPDTMLAAGPVTSDTPQTGVRVGRAGITPEQSAKAGGLDRPLVALLDTLAGALKGATAQTLGLPGDIRSILDMINKEGATKYLGEPVLPTTEEMQKKLPAVVPEGVANQADREFTANIASEIGTFLPAPGVPEAAIQGVKAVGKAIKATKNMPVGLSIQPVGELGDALLMAVKVGDKELKIPGDKAAVLQKAIKNLTPEEQGKLRTDTAIKMVDILTTLPSTKEFAAAAVGGIAKKGWYEGSAKAIIEVFGQDAPRFAALLSATSPQTSVESNLYNALQTWKNWTAAGRPQDRESIISVMGQSVQGSKGEESVLDAWKNNSVRALTTEDPSTLTLSGPKVDSFMKNLQGNVEQVTNDAWMASFSLVDQTIFSGSLTKTDAGKGPGYLAMNARVRDTAKYLTKLTGETWTPAEVQETIWSWAKTLYEKASDANETRSALQLIKENAITDDLIASTPDFRTLFYDERYAPILEQAGYKDQLDRLRTATATDNGGTGVQKSRSSSETGKALGSTQSKLLESNAKRLDQLRLNREQASADKAPTKGVK